MPSSVLSCFCHTLQLIGDQAALSRHADDRALLDDDRHHQFPFDDTPFGIGEGAVAVVLAGVVLCFPVSVDDLDVVVVVVGDDLGRPPPAVNVP